MSVRATVLLLALAGCGPFTMGPFYAASKAHPYCNADADCNPSQVCRFPHTGSRAICTPGENPVDAYPPDTDSASF